ncbi:DNA alkylation repair protein [Evansella halocellulosilytica]|uniref:DNA alkylation repair protein n=1 Tax=Evansella halocellulosilytica TaxID=2011013 RepID=UPI000BB82873|nr:DNA alkylation repair protein [Evansella halocellulosilytica]
MYVKNLRERLENEANRETAIPMEKYMKNHFQFLGIKSPQLKGQLKQFFNETDILKVEPFPIQVINQLWELPEREYQYAALNILHRRRKELHRDHIRLLEKLITTKSWWDTVDTLASNIVGPLFLRERELIETYILSWQTSENMWLRRTAILHQLKYKEMTNADRLFQIIRLNRHDKEFFIQKAIGWALREYSKTNPASVEAFIKSEDLSKLSIREGMKHLKKEAGKKS